MLRVQYYANQELPGVQAGFRKWGGIRDLNCQHSLDQRKLGNSRKTSISVSSTMPQPLTLWSITNCGKLLKRLETRPSYLFPEKPVCGSRSNTRNTVLNKWLVQDWKRSTTGLSSVTLLNLYAEHTMRNAGLDELQAEKIGGKDISNIRYADDTTLMAESE